MNKDIPLKDASLHLWTKNKPRSNSENISRLLVDQLSNSNDPEIDRSLYFLGRALYRYSLLQKEGSDNES